MIRYGLFKRFNSRAVDCDKRWVNNSSLVDELGIKVICENIKDYFEGWQVVTRKTEWENRFRTAIWEIKRKLVK